MPKSWTHPMVKRTGRCPACGKDHRSILKDAGICTRCLFLFFAGFAHPDAHGPAR